MERSLRRVRSVLAVFSMSATILVALQVSSPATVAGGDTRLKGPTISFAGYDWVVRGPEHGGPGPNRWDPANVWVDVDGALHLRVTHDARGWSCAELRSIERLGFGTYRWVVDGPVDRLDPNVVLGLFPYPAPDVGADGTNEIDIEYSRWGDPTGPAGSFTVWPAEQGLPPATKAFTFSLAGATTSSTFTRTPNRVTFRSQEGSTILGRWRFAPPDPTRRISQDPMLVHMNLWLLLGHPPTGGQEVEIVIRSFSFTPWTS